MRLCPYCNTAVSEDHQFCPECGRPLATGEVGVGGPVEGKSKKKLVGIIVACIVAVIVIVVIATRPPTPAPTPTQFNTYSKYGFSFEYPNTFSVTEMGILESQANDTSGLVMAGVENGELEYFQVVWVKAMPDVMELGPGGLAGSLKASLEDGFAGMETSEGITSVEEGELVETTKAGHLMFCQYYSVTSTEGPRAYGIVSCFYCDESLKLFGLMTMNDTISANEDVLEDFQNYLDSFVCH